MVFSTVLAIQGALSVAQLRPVSLAQATEMAEAHGPDLVEPKMAIPIAKAGVEFAGQWPNPTLTGSVGPDEPTLWASLDQRLPVFGQIGTAIDAAKMQVLATEDSLQLRRVLLQASVRRAYFALVEAEAQRALMAERLARAQALVALTRKKLDLGSAAQFDVEQVVLAAKRAEQAQQDQLVETQRARLTLDALVGYWEGDGLQATDPLLPLPALPTLDSLLARIPAHPEVVLTQRQAAVARARATKEGAAIRPTPDVALTLEQLTPCTPGLPTGKCDPTSTTLGLRAGLSFDLPVLSQNRGAVHQAEQEALQADALAEVALRRRTQQARLAHASLLAAVRRSTFLEQEVVPQALRVEQLARVAYEVGRAPLIQILQAQAEVTDVQSQALATAAAAQTAFADVEEAVGAAL